MGKRKTLKQRTQKLILTRQAKGGYIDKDGKLYSQTEGTELIMTGKASLSSWHGSKKKDKVSYEGAQYAGGRVKGKKNLVRTEDGFINEHGVEFTLAERKALESEVNKANRKRMKMLNEEGSLPRLVGGQDSGQTVASLHALGSESDFILARKSKSLQRFKTRQDFEIYMDNLRLVNSPEYLDERTRLYKKNHMKALKNVFGSDADDVYWKLHFMPLDEYRRRIQSDEDLEVSYIYDPSALAGKLNQIRSALGMGLKEEPIEE